MITKQPIREFSGKIIAWVITDSDSGDKTLTNFNGVVLGYYRKNRDVTTDFYGKELSKGDTLTMLITNDIN